MRQKGLRYREDFEQLSLGRDEEPEDEDDYYYDEGDGEDFDPFEEYYEEDEEATNYWSNPTRGKYRYSDEGKGRRRRRENGTTRRTSYKSTAAPPAPGFLKEFYDKLFWYGIDTSQTTSAGDRTMFGGTRGKFNGLKVIEDQQRLYQQENYDDDDDYDDDYDDEDNDEDEEYFAGIERRRRARREAARSSNSAQYRISDGSFGANTGETPQESFQLAERTPTQSNRRRTTRAKRTKQPQATDRVDSYQTNGYEWLGDGSMNDVYSYRKRGAVKNDDLIYEEGESWTREEVSNWFNGEEDDDSYSSESKPSLVGDVFEKIREGSETKMKKAVQWDNSYSPQRLRGRIDPSYDVVDVEVEDYTGEDEMIERGRISSQAKRRRRSGTKRRVGNEKELIDAIDRVPPIVGAWGPEGELVGMNAREKAIMEAVRELDDARRVVEEERAALSVAEERRSIAKAAVLLQRKRISDRRDYISASEGAQIRVKLRTLDADVTETKRAARKAEDLVYEAESRLQELESLHSALLKLAGNDSSKQLEADQAMPNTNSASETYVRPSGVESNNDCSGDDSLPTPTVGPE
uniref:Uncharacterized protein n=2 Tax=Leptocylindrus danicus TaxID=163516 RepID=A0A7S2NU50_9STRA